MHEAVKRVGTAFFKLYGTTGCKVLELGSRYINGSLRETALPGMDYLGIDLEEGRDVDLVVPEGPLPFPDESFDLVVSSSCLEHDKFFWQTFVEMVRVTRTSGFIFFTVPSAGLLHREPVDCWRFYPDAPIALAEWSTRQGYPVNAVEAWRMVQDGDGWQDCIGVFSRLVTNVPHKIMDEYPELVRKSEHGGIYVVRPSGNVVEL